jgi:gas vesicle protein
MKSHFGFVHGAMWGGVIGAAVGILLAPMSGKQLRQAIKDHTSYVIEEGQRAAEAKRLELEQEFAEMRRVRYE